MTINKPIEIENSSGPTPTLTKKGEEPSKLSGPFDKMAFVEITPEIINNLYTKYFNNLSYIMYFKRETGELFYIEINHPDILTASYITHEFLTSSNNNIYDIIAPGSGWTINTEFQLDSNNNYVTDDDQVVFIHNTTNPIPSCKIPSTKPVENTYEGQMVITMNPGYDPTNLFSGKIYSLYDTLTYTTTLENGLDQHTINYKFIDDGLSGLGFGMGADSTPETENLISIDTWGNVPLTRLSFGFQRFYNLRSMPSNPQDIPIILENGGTMHYLTINMGALVPIEEKDYSNMQYWDINNSVSLNGLFYTINIENCTTKQYTKADGSTYTAWDTSNTRIFNRCFKKTNATESDLSRIDLNWDTSKGFMFYQTFQGTINATDIIGNLDYSNAINFYQMLDASRDFSQNPENFTKFVIDLANNTTVPTIKPEFAGSTNYYLGNIESFLIKSSELEVGLSNLLNKGFQASFDGIYTQDQVDLQTKTNEFTEGLPTSLAITSDNNMRLRMTVAKSLIIDDTTEDLDYITLWSWQTDNVNPAVNLAGDNWELGKSPIRRTVSNDNLYITYDFDLNIDMDLYNSGYTTIGLFIREKNTPANTVRNLSGDLFFDLSQFNQIDNKYYIDGIVKNILNKKLFKVVNLDYSTDISALADYNVSDKYTLILNDIGGFKTNMWYGQHSVKLNLDPTKYTYITGRGDTGTKIQKESLVAKPKYLYIPSSNDIQYIVPSGVIPTKIKLTFEYIDGNMFLFNTNRNPYFYINLASRINSSGLNEVEFINDNDAGTLNIYANGNFIMNTTNFIGDILLNIWGGQINLFTYEIYDSSSTTSPIFKFDAEDYDKGTPATEIPGLRGYDNDPNNLNGSSILGGDLIEELYTFGTEVDSFIINGIERIIISSNAINKSGFNIFVSQINEKGYKLPLTIRDYNENDYNFGLLPDQVGNEISTLFNPKFRRGNSLIDSTDLLTSYTTEELTKIEIVSPLDTNGDDNDEDEYDNEQLGGFPLDSSVAGKIVLIQRGGYDYNTKVQNAQAGGAKGVIIYNSNVETTNILGPSVDPSIGFQGPIIFIDNFTGHFILDTLRRNKVYGSFTIEDGLATDLKVSYDKSILVGGEEVALTLLDNTLPSTINILDSTEIIDIKQTFSTSEVTNYFYNSTRFAENIETTVAEFNGLRVIGIFANNQYTYKCIRISDGKSFGETVIDGSGFPYMLSDRVTGEDGTQYDINIHGIGSTLFSIDDLSVVIPCLTETCNVLTPNGYVNVSGLKENDMVITSDDRQVPIFRIFKSVSTKLPRVIRAGQYGNVPLIDTHLSDCHAYKVNNKWKLPKEENLQIEWHEDQVTYYHIELPDYYNDHLVVNGLTTESWDGFLPNDIRPHMWEKAGKNKTSVVLKVKN